MAEFTAKYQRPDEKDQDEDDDLDEGSNATSHKKHARSPMLLIATLVLMIALAASLVLILIGSKSYDNKDNKDKFVDRGLKPIRDFNNTGTAEFRGTIRYVSVCNDGFERSGSVSRNDKSCRDIDECTGNVHNCDTHALCKNTIGSYECICSPGFKGNGSFCHDIDECKDGTHRCHTHAACTNTDGSYKCSCISGFGGDGQVCRDIDESRDGSHDRSCRATCTKTVGFYSCSCNDGFHGDDRFCFDNDGCGDGSRLCGARASCVNKPGSNSWSYRKGYTGNGRYCEGQEESVLSLPDNVLKSVQTMDKEDVVEEFKRSLRIGEASLQQPDEDTKRWVRCLFETAASKDRDDLVQHLRQITPAGTTGPRLPERLHVRDIPMHIMRDLTTNLSGGDEWKLLAERFGFTQAQIRYLVKRTMNPCNATLHFIANRYPVTVGDLYSLLVDCELPTMADLL